MTELVEQFARCQELADEREAEVRALAALADPRREIVVLVDSTTSLREIVAGVFPLSDFAARVRRLLEDDRAEAVIGDMARIRSGGEVPLVVMSGQAIATFALPQGAKARAARTGRPS